MKKQTKIISFILALSLILSSIVFTVSAAGSVDIEDLKNIEYYDPTAVYETIDTDAEKMQITGVLGNAKFGTFQNMYGQNGCLKTYCVESKEDGNKYLMVVPTETAANKGTVSAQSYMDTSFNQKIKYSAGTPMYYVLEFDVTTDSEKYLPFSIIPVARRTSDGSGQWSTPFIPDANYQALITPGEFHHIAMIGDISTNILYVFVDNAYVGQVANGITSSTFFTEFKGGAEMTISGSRFQISGGASSPKGSSFCLDSVNERLLSGTEQAGNLADCIAKGSLVTWEKNVNSLTTEKHLPSLANINGTKYNNPYSASKALDTYKLGNTVKILRSCYSDVITVNCDAVIEKSLFEVTLEAGSDVTIVKGDGTTWVSKLKAGVFKYSAYNLPGLTNTGNVEQYIRYNADNNLIYEITQYNAINPRKFSLEDFANLTPEQQACFSSRKEMTEEAYNNLSSTEKKRVSKVVETVSGQEVTKYYYYELTEDEIAAKSFNSEAFTSHAAAGNITRTDSGNEYLIIRDASDQTGDFPLNVHYQINANTHLNYSKDTSPFKLQGHTFIVFEQDIYSESTFINIYSGFNLRTPDNIALSATQVFAQNISISPYKWYHLTYVGDVATGDSYLFLDGICITKVVGGLYDDISLERMATSMGIENNVANKQTLVDNMLLASFRTMQIAGENDSGKLLTLEMSAASDNYYLRWVDETSTTQKSLSSLITRINDDYSNIPEDETEPDCEINGTYSISDWDHNIFNTTYTLPERATIATINGVSYYDTTTIDKALNDTNYTTSLQEIVLYRNYIGTININCRASVKINGTTSGIAYGSDLTVVHGDITQVYKQTGADQGDTYYPVACVNGVLYYSNAANIDADGDGKYENEDALKKLLEEDISSTEFKVTFLRVPTVSINVTANAVLDFNGLNTGVTVNSVECARIDGESTTKVVNLKTTIFVATMNGVDYRNDADGVAALQAALTSANSVTLSLYNVPSTPLKICCSANIDTNGLVAGDIKIEDLITTDFTQNSIESTEGTYDYSIVDGNLKYATIKVVISTSAGTQVKTVVAQLGDDIATVLTRNGLMSEVVLTKDSNGTTAHLITWDSIPSGTVSREDENGESAYTFTATATESKLLTGKYAYVQNGKIYDDANFTENNARNWISSSAISSIILNADLTITSNVSFSGNKDVYLNGYTLTSTSNDQAFSFGAASGNTNFYGDGTINYNDNISNKAIFYTAYDFTHTITVNNININTHASVGIMREASLELNGCTIDAYNVGAIALFSLGEEYKGYTQRGITLTLRDCDITYRFPNIVDSYTNFTATKPLIYNKIITHEVIKTGNDTYVTGELVEDAVRTILIDGCSIKSQGSIVQANLNQSNNENDYLKSKMSLYINNSDIIAKSYYQGKLKPDSIFLVDDVRTNIEGLDNVRIPTNLVIAKTSDGVYKNLYTSHDYATITWSDKVTEFWAVGSTPTNRNSRFDNITPGITDEQVHHEYTSTGTSFPFGLIANLTLSDVIGFNVYVPVELKNGTKVNHEDVMIYLDGKRVYANTYADSDEIRTTVVKAAANYGDGICYDFTINFAPQDAAKEFTIVIIYGGKCVSRTVSIADYANALIENGLNEKNKALLQTTLKYIEQATMYAGNTMDMSKITALIEKLGTNSVTPTAEPTAPDVTHAETLADFSQYITHVQINVKSNCAFRFMLADGVDASGFRFYVANDKNDGYEARSIKIVTDGKHTYLELSLRAYEMARMLKITYNGQYCNYNLYKCYKATSEMAASATKTGITEECKAAVKLIEAMYSYAVVCDQYLNANDAEYAPKA